MAFFSLHLLQSQSRNSVGRSSTRVGLPWTLRGASRPRAASFSCAVLSFCRTVRSTFRPRGFSRASGMLAAHGGRRYVFFTTRFRERDRLTDNGWKERGAPYAPFPARASIGRFWSFPVQFCHVGYVCGMARSTGNALTIVIGFTLLAATSFISGRDLLGAFFFTLSLGFKQMALYYAPAVGSYLIGKCLYLGPRDGYVGSPLHLSVSLATAHSFSFVSQWLRRAPSCCFPFLSYPHWLHSPPS